MSSCAGNPAENKSLSIVHVDTPGIIVTLIYAVNVMQPVTYAALWYVNLGKLVYRYRNVHLTIAHLLIIKHY